MAFRNALVVWLCFGAAAAYGQVNQGNGFLFQFPGQGAPGSRFIGYIGDSNPLNPVIDDSGPSGSYRILAKPDGTKFYIYSNDQLQVIDENLGTLQAINSVQGTIRAALMTPDGRYLVVAASTLYFVDTVDDSIAATGIGITAPVTYMEVSRDSKTLWVTTQSGFAGSLISVDLEKLERIPGPFTLPFRPRGIFLSPLGLLYVTFTNRILEIDPETMTVTPQGEIEILSTPGPMRFTPNGKVAYIVNLDPQIGNRPLMRLDLASPTRDVTEWITSSPVPIFEDVFPVGNDRVFAYSRDRQTLFAVTPSPLSAVETSLGGILPFENVLGIAVSNELPSSLYLFALLDNGNQTNLVRIELAGDTVSAQALARINSGFFQYVPVPAQTGAAAFHSLTEGRDVEGGDTVRIVMRVIGQTGAPVFNIPVTVTTDPDNGATIDPAQLVSNRDGYIQTSVTIPDEPGDYTFNFNAGLANTSLTFTVREEGGGTPGGPQLITIVGGDGQLLREFFGTPVWQPLSVRLQDAEGNPRVGFPVTFSIVEGFGNIGSGTINTDENGIASTSFFASNVPFGISFQATTVRATSELGSVDFKVTTYRLNSDNVTGQPEIRILKPTSIFLDIGQGDLIPEAVTAQINSASFPDIGTPIPNVGMRISAADDITSPGPAACEGLSRSDSMGIARCNLRAGCVEGDFRNFGARVIVGENKDFPLTLRIGPGSPSKFERLSGQEQTGRAGSTLQQFVARVTDRCGSPVDGIDVDWTLIQGDGTLSNATSTSDAGGRVSTTLTLGPAPGQLIVRASAGGFSVDFTATSEVVVSRLNLVSGGGQTAAVSTLFQSPVVFEVLDTNNNPVSNILVRFSVTGSAGISPAQATSNAQGRVQTTVTAGDSPGTVRITAAFNTLTAVATLTVEPPAPVGPVIESFFNNASGATGLVACGLATVRGEGIAPGITGVVSNISPFGPLPYVLNGVEIRVNGVAAPIRSLAPVDSTQQDATFQVPCETATGTANVQVSVNGVGTTVGGVQVLVAQPGIYTYLGPGGIQYGAVIRALDGSYVTPSSLARRGEEYFVILTGLGKVTPAAATNSVGTGTQDVNLDVIVGVNNAGVPVTSARYLAGAIGVYIVGFTIPEDAVAGTDQPLAVAVVVNGQNVFGNQVFLPGVN